MFKTNISLIFILLVSIILQIIDTVSLTKTSTSFDVWAVQYAFQIFASMRIDLFNIMLFLMISYIVKKRDLRTSLQLCDDVTTLI